MMPADQSEYIQVQADLNISADNESSSINDPIFLP